MKSARCRRFFVAAVFGAIALRCPVEGVAAESPTVQRNANRDHVVFVGLDLFVEHRGQPRPIIRATDRDVVVRVDGKEARVPLRNATMSLTSERKLSGHAITLTALDGYPVHSPVTNPMADAQDQMLAVASIQANTQERADSEARLAEQGARDAARRGASSAERATVDQRATQAASARDAAYATPLLRESLPGSGTTRGGFDGFEVTFRAAAANPQSSVYGLMRLLVRDPARPELSAIQALQFFRVGKLDTKRRKIIVRKFGLPIGWDVENYEIHLYTEGRELVTNLSRNRIELDREEAHEFCLQRHLQANAAATLPAHVVEELRPALSTVGISAAQATATVDISLTADGRIDEIRQLPSVPGVAGAKLETALREVLFLPALVEGKPAASSGTFALSELFH